MLLDPQAANRPPRLRPEDEGLHAAPPHAEDALWGDAFWLTVQDAAADVFGVNHFFLTNRGFGRYQAHYWLDGVQQSYSRKALAAAAAGAMSWSDGRLTYEVVAPFDAIRLTMDNPKYGFDLEFRGRYPAYDYDDHPGGSPLGGMAPTSSRHGGHYAQAMTCRGWFEIRGGPASGQTREINCLAYRDHSWSDRFASETPWEYLEDDSGLHYRLVLNFAQRTINAIGFFDGGGPSGFESSDSGHRAVTEVVVADREAPALRDHAPRRFRLQLDSDPQPLHVRVISEQVKAKLQLLGEDDAESRIDDWETLAEVEIEETGERGYGVIEHSVLPPRPRWLI
jgi:hypothetical protein